MLWLSCRQETKFGSVGFSEYDKSSPFETTCQFTVGTCVVMAGNESRLSLRGAPLIFVTRSFSRNGTPVNGASSFCPLSVSIVSCWLVERLAMEIAIERG